MQDFMSQASEIHALRQENEHYKGLLSGLCAAIVVFSVPKERGELRVLEVNGFFTGITGYTLEDIDHQFGGLYLDMVDERDREGLWTGLLEQFAQSGRYELSYRLKTKTGGTVWIRENGQRRGLHGMERQSILFDISALVWHQEQLAQSEQLFRITNEASGGAVFDFDFSSGTYLHFENAERIYGVPASRIISETQWFGTLSPQKAQSAMIDYFYHPDDADLVAAAFSRLGEEKETHYIARSKRHDGTFLWTQVHIALIFDESGQPVRRVGNLLNIDQLKRHADEMAQSEQLFRITNRASGGAVFDYDLVSGVYRHFENAERIYGVPAEKIISDTRWFGTLSPQKSQNAMIAYFYHPDDAYIVSEAFVNLAAQREVTYVARSRRFDGRFIWSRVHIALILNEHGIAVRRVGHILDIDEMITQMETLKNQAQSDPLTGVYNKIAAQTIVETVLKKRECELSALLVLDIDNFKGVNDALGHAQGDAVLLNVCAKLKKAFSDQTIGRVGGDEFIVFVMGLHSEAEVLEQAQRVCALFRQTYVGPNDDYKISCSIGIAISNNESGFAELFKKADSALYKAKSHGKDCYYLYEANRM